MTDPTDSTDPTDDSPEASVGSQGGRLGIVAAVLLGIAATLTALSAWQAALADGDALAGYTDSNAGLTAATFLYNQGNQVRASDEAVFLEYAAANTEGNTDLSDYLFELMRPELQAAVDWWNETDESITPFEDAADNPYEVAEIAEGDEVIAEAEKRYDEGAAADEKGDEFELSTVLFALALFFGGIATLFRRRGLSVALLSMGALALIVGAVQMAAGFSA